MIRLNTIETIAL